MKKLTVCLCLSGFIMNQAWGKDSVPAKSQKVLQAPFETYDPLTLKKIFDRDLSSIVSLRMQGVVALGAATIPEFRQDVTGMAEEFGFLLGKAGVPVRTGGGPGIMEAVPKGNQAGLREVTRGRLAANMRGLLEESSPVRNRIASLIRILTRKRTQGVALNLPNEPRNPWIEATNSGKMAHFPYRKEALLNENLGVMGGIMFPGGVGTFEEIFQIWALEEGSENPRPLIAMSSQFFTPWLETLRQVAATDRNLISGRAFELLKIADSPKEAVSWFLESQRPIKPDYEAFHKKLKLNMEKAIDALSDSPWSLAVLGAKNIPASDPAVLTVREAVSGLISEGIPVKVARNDSWLRGLPQALSQGIRGFFRSTDLESLVEFSGISMGSFETQSAHNEAMIDKSFAYVVLPGDLDTLMQLFTILDWIKMGQLLPRPVILVGSDYWQPLFTSVENSLKNGLSKSFPKEAKKVCTVTDDPGEIVRIVRDFYDQREDVI